jgi:DnaK suppressor protein
LEKKMTRRELPRFKSILTTTRDEIVSDLSRLEDEIRAIDFDGPKDVGDLSTAGMSKESLLEEASRKRNLLRLVESALQRLRTETFGVCVDCADEIASRRLEAVPWARFCLRCQQQLEIAQMHRAMQV